MRFGEYAKLLFARKVELGDLASLKSVETWESVLNEHLMPYFGEYYLDAITKSDIANWLSIQARLVTSKKYSPNSVNSWLAKLKVIMAAATDEFDLAKDPALRVKPLDASTWRTYTREAPNALRAVDVPRFLREMRLSFPQHYAFCALGFATGLRPSSLRPLRRIGSQADLDWATGILWVRRSHTVRQEVMEKTKTARDQEIALPQEMLEILKWHVDRLPRTRKDSELLFPGKGGRLRSRSCLDKPFEAVARAIELKYPVTPRAMRRTFKDLCRAAAVQDVVSKQVSGHVTDEMHEHYQTVHLDEQRQALAKVIELFKAA